MSHPQSVSKSSQADKAAWDVHLIRVFVEICVERCLAGDKPGMHFTREGWKRVIDEFERRTGKSYEQTQFKNKWDNLKRDWRIWEKLRGEIGAGWDSIRKTIVADNEWWERKIKEDKRYAKFQHQSIENMEGLEILFGGQLATGKHALNPARDDDPVVHINQVDPVGTQPHLQSTASSSDPNYNANSLSSSPPPEPVSTRRRRSSTPTGVGKRGRATSNIRGSRRPTEFAMSMANLTEVIANRGKSHSEDEESKSLNDAMGVLETMEDLLASENLTVFALSLMETHANRKFLLGINKPEWRLMWIKDKWSRQMYTPSKATASGGGWNVNSPGTAHSSTDVYTPVPPAFSPTYGRSSGLQGDTVSPAAPNNADDHFSPFG